MEDIDNKVQIDTFQGEETWDGDGYQCPECLDTVIFSYCNYCPWCGLALDWSLVEEYLEFN